MKLVNFCCTLQSCYYSRLGWPLFYLQYVFFSPVPYMTFSYFPFLIFFYTGRLLLTPQLHPCHVILFFFSSHSSTHLLHLSCLSFTAAAGPVKLIFAALLWSPIKSQIGFFTYPIPLAICTFLPSSDFHVDNPSYCMVFLFSFLLFFFFAVLYFCCYRLLLLLIMFVCHCKTIIYFLGKNIYCCGITS